MKRIIRLFSLLAVLASLVAFSRPPEPMTRIVGEAVYPDGQTIPFTWWRVGFILARVEGMGLNIYREPENWTIDAEGVPRRYAVDPGPSLGFHVPVIAYEDDPDFGTELVYFEVAMERDFMTGRKIEPESGPGEGQRTYRWTDPENCKEALLVVSAESGLPLRAEIRDGGTAKVVLVYREYVTGLPVDFNLFAPPEGLVFPE